jgi:hypothetical protein
MTARLFFCLPPKNAKGTTGKMKAKQKQFFSGRVILQVTRQSVNPLQPNTSNGSKKVCIEPLCVDLYPSLKGFSARLIVTQTEVLDGKRTPKPINNSLRGIRLQLATSSFKHIYASPL